MGMMGIFFFSSPLSATLTSLLTHPPPSPMKKKRLNNKTWLDLNIYIYIKKHPTVPSRWKSESNSIPKIPFPWLM